MQLLIVELQLLCNPMDFSYRPPEGELTEYVIQSGMKIAAKVMAVAKNNQ